LRFSSAGEDLEVYLGLDVDKNTIVAIRLATIHIVNQEIGMTNEPPVLLNEQILAISKLTGQMRTSLQTVRAAYRPIPWKDYPIWKVCSSASANR